MRLPQVHDTVKQGLISPYIDIARERGAAAYIGNGANRWSAAHVRDVAKLYVLALDKGLRGARYHAVDEEGIAVRRIAEVVAAGLGVPSISLSPDEAEAHLGWLAIFAGVDMAASSAWTRAELSWQSSGPGLIADLEAMDYAAATAA
jgi:nucleoside-diphosphate-sugar epimerase